MKAPCIASLALLATVVSSAAQAGLLQDFRFNDANGTVITGAANSIAPGNNWLSQNTVVQSAVNNGAFRIQKTTPTGQVGNTLDIANVSTGKVWLVANIAGWHYTATGSTPLERVRFGFLDNTDPVAAGSSTVTAEMTIDRLVDNSLVLSGEALGTGSTNIAADLPLTLSRSANLKIVLELDKNLDKYSVYYKDGAGPLSLLGTADLGASTLNAGDRDGNSLRLAFTGTYGDVDEFFDIGRIYVTDDFGLVPEPSSMALAAFALAALVGWRRRA